METLQTLSLLGATVAMGLVAGVFGLYAHTIMPGLAKTDDRTFVGAFQAIDRAIINPWFLGGEFVGALVLTAVAAVLHWGEDPLPLIAIALALYSLTFTITLAVNVPLNDSLKAAGDPDAIADLTATRLAFAAGRWARWNLVRTLASTAAFGCLAAALML